MQVGDLWCNMSNCLLGNTLFESANLLLKKLLNKVAKKKPKGNELHFYNGIVKKYSEH